MILLTCMQTSSTMSTCIININNDHDHDSASPLLPPHLSIDDNNNNGRYPDHHDHPYQQHRQRQKGSRCDTSRVLRYVFYLFFSFEFTTNEYIYFRLLTTTQRLPRHLRGDVAAVSDTIELRGTDRLEKWQGEGMGLETRLVLSPWYVFLSFLLEYTDT